MKKIILASIISMMFGSVMAQSTAPTTNQPTKQPNTNSPLIDKREANQDNRINQGVANGSLTQKEANKLNRKLDGIDRAEARMKSDGNLTRKERENLHHRLDQSSKQIYREKHDRQVDRDHDGRRDNLRPPSPRPMQSAPGVRPMNPGNTAGVPPHQPPRATQSQPAPWVGMENKGHEKHKGNNGKHKGWEKGKGNNK